MVGRNDEEDTSSVIHCINRSTDGESLGIFLNSNRFHWRLFLISPA